MKDTAFVAHELCIQRSVISSNNYKTQIITNTVISPKPGLTCVQGYSGLGSTLGLANNVTQINSSQAMIELCPAKHSGDKPKKQKKNKKIPKETLVAYFTAIALIKKFPLPI